MNRKKIGALQPWQIILLILLPIAVSFAALCIGRMSIAPMDVIHSILNKFGGSYAVNPQIEQVLWTMRFPRILLGLLVGAGLSAVLAAQK